MYGQGWNLDLEPGVRVEFVKGPRTYVSRLAVSRDCMQNLLLVSDSRIGAWGPLDPS